MIDELIQLLESFKYPVFRQGSLPEGEEYPETFFTFWENGEDGHSYYDNEINSATYDIDVNVYSTDADTVYKLLEEARQLLRTHGWIIYRRGYDVPSDENTHTGRGMQILFIKNEN